MKYDFSSVEEEIKAFWQANKTYTVTEQTDKPKFYVLDMFPYPSGSGLHVGHPLGYIASDIYARYKRLKGFNVLHPMGYDAFGLPAEQYAIQTGQHPAVTTEANIKRYREQLDKIGFCFDWNREVRTSDPAYYKWTQWIFIQLFNHWYDHKTQRAQPITKLIALLETEGTAHLHAAQTESLQLTPADWKNLSPKQQSDVLLNYRLAFLSQTMVNWCPALGTVLANDEVKDGKSERGGHEVIQKKMWQWSLRITAYAERLLNGLDQLDWTESLKDMQRNWIGKSVGAEIAFQVADSEHKIKVFTTRPDTIFGVTFMVLAPEHELVNLITTPTQRQEITEYQTKTALKSELDRLAEVKEASGAFTGAYAINPFTSEKIPIYIGDYVLAGYGTGAIMAVPGGDERDFRFAKQYNLPIIATLDGADVSEKADESKVGILANSGFLNGLSVADATLAVIKKVEEWGIGKAKTNFKIRDAVFGRQRYWGEPIPIYYDDARIPHALPERELPLELPKIEAFLPTAEGEPPLARATDWKYKNEFQYELTTMPGWAGSSWYYLRYMDPKNPDAFVAADKLNYWGQVDLYIGGAEHATGHLLYFRFWTKFLHDIGALPFDEPAKKLINQGMIQAEDGQKMSKRYGNVVNPDDVIAEHGADALRLHEMFLGPIEQHKPWNTKGIEGVSRFLRKMWALFTPNDRIEVSEETPTKAEFKVLHTAIKGITDDLERYSFNTVVSKLMVCVNELGNQKCNKRAILEPLLVLAAPYCPFITEKLWTAIGHSNSILESNFPDFNPDFLKEDAIEYPVMINGKMRFKLTMPSEASASQIEEAALKHELAIKWFEGKTPKKVIVVPGKIVNVVI